MSLKFLLGCRCGRGQHGQGATDGVHRNAILLCRLYGMPPIIGNHDSGGGCFIPRVFSKMLNSISVLTLAHFFYLKIPCTEQIALSKEVQMFDRRLSRTKPRRVSASNQGVCGMAMPI